MLKLIFHLKEKVFFLLIFLFPMFAQALNIPFAQCAIENRWQSNYFFSSSNDTLSYDQNNSGVYPTSQTWTFESIPDKPSNFYRIKNNDGYLTRQGDSIMIVSNPDFEEGAYWEILLKDGYYLLMVPCENRGLHIENLTGLIQLGPLSFGWSSAQWILHDASGGSGASMRMAKQEVPVKQNKEIGHKEKVAKTDQFIEDLINSKADRSRRKEATKWKLAKDLEMAPNVKLTKYKGKSSQFSGKMGNPKVTFKVEVVENNLNGEVIDYENNRAFRLKNQKGDVISEEVDINELVCIDYTTIDGAGGVQDIITRGCDIPDGMDIYSLNSLPGAEAVVYLDFDGEYVVSPSWEGGEPIDAVPMNLSEGWIYTIWKGIAEDFLPFQLNITTDSAVFNQAAPGKRMRVIFTNTNFRGSGGVAKTGSFTWTDDVPCWVFNNFSPQGIWDTGSHEIGHTLGLSHDGFKDGNNFAAYYSGQGDWAPIMGESWDHRMAQWCKGEYQHANNSQDDLEIIATQNGFGYRTDDYPGDISNATPFNLSEDLENTAFMKVEQSGIIETNTDKDFFMFTMSDSGRINLNFLPAYPGPNLNIEMALYDNTLSELQRLNPDGPYVEFTTVLPAGNYYIEVTGAGEADPFTNGYSDYCSIGEYTINGEIESVVSPVYPASIAITDLSPGAATVLLEDINTIEYDENGVPNSRLENLLLEVTDGSGIVVADTLIDSLTQQVFNFTWALPAGLEPGSYSLKVTAISSTWFGPLNGTLSALLVADCNGDLNGNAEINPTCGACYGGNTGLTDIEACPCHAPEFNINQVYFTVGTEVTYEGKIYENKWHTQGVAPGSSEGPWLLTSFCSAEPLNCTGFPAWSSSAAYSASGTLVEYNGNLYESQWHNSNQNPETSDAWLFLGPCGGTANPETGADNIITSVETSLKDNVIAYPNPANAFLSVDLGMVVENGSYIISGLDGQQISQGPVNGNSLTIEVSQLDAGMYMLNIMDPVNGNISMKFGKK